MWLVDIIESESGWGQRLDETREFPTERKALNFVEKYNRSNDKVVVPDWYMRANTPREVK